MQLINTAFAELCKYFETNETLDINQEQEHKTNFDFGFLTTLKTMSGLIIEVCGYWVWLSGNTYPHKEVISNLGFKFSGAKKSWYWSPTIDINTYKLGSKSMKNIRKDYGSQIIETETQTALN